jgi:hypothetical protein
MDTVAIALLVLSTAGSLLLVPDIRAADLIEPTIQAALTTPVVFTALLVMRLRGWRPIAERRLLALFLGMMPTVYLLAGALHGITPSWLAVEVIGQIFFAAVALAGLWWSPWFLVTGIAAHGLLWDLPHHGRAPFMADWYAIGCLVVDVGWAGYAALRVPAWEAERKPVSAPSHFAAEPVVAR